LSLKLKNNASILGRVDARFVLKQSGLTKNKIKKIKQNRRIRTMKSKKDKKGGSHIKVQGLRNSEMKATLGAIEEQQTNLAVKTYACGHGGGECTRLTVNIHSLISQHTVDIYQ
jgi:hypothetical protein